MKTTTDEQKYPWWTIPLLALASFQFEYNWEEGAQFSYNGTETALIVIGIISITMVFNVQKGIQRVLKAHKFIENIPRSRFWMLLPFSIILPAIGYSAVSEVGFTDERSGDYLYQWDFCWGSTALHIWLILGTLAIIFLHTIILTLHEIERTANS